MGPGIEEIKRDLSPLMNLSSGTWEEPGDTEEDKPLTGLCSLVSQYKIRCWR